MKNSSPANITTPITFALAGIFVGIITIASGNRLKIQAQAGSEVLPVTTAIKKAPANTSMPRYPRYMV